MMQPDEELNRTKSRSRRLIYALSMRYLGIALVCCAAAGGAFRSRMYFVFSLCAAGGIFLAWGWFSYLAVTGLKVPGAGSLPKARPDVPYSLRQKKRRWQKPAFARTDADFEDDLTARTHVSEGEFDELQLRAVRIRARLLCSAALFALSLIIRY